MATAPRSPKAGRGKVRARAILSRFGGIQARAIARAGATLKLIEKARNQHDAEKRAQDGAVPSRTQAATDAGLSERQRKTALRVANIPEQEFEEAIESENPPTVKLPEELS